MALEQRDKDFLKLLMRSPDEGEGWRRVSELLWPMVQAQHERTPELLRIKSLPSDNEVDEYRRYVRLSAEGKVVVEWLV